MTDQREALAASLAHSRRGVTANVNDNDRHQADVILAEFLVVPRSDVTTEYGWQYEFMTGRWTTHAACDEADAHEAASSRRYFYDPGDVRAVSRETWASPWSPIPLPEDGKQ